MKLYIQLEKINNLYNLIKIDETGQHCLLQDTLENCRQLFNTIISEHSSPTGIMYYYDSINHLVIDHTSGKPKTKILD